jgi:pimeloyl-ACP methyl ester carboxylesterase
VTSHRPSLRLAVAVLLCLGLSGCVFGGRSGGSDDDGDTQPQPAASSVTVPGGVSDPADDPELARFYEQDVAWERCLDDDVQCAEMTVPLDWDDPAGETITIALTRSQASGDRIGSLVFNPGGPGVGARDSVEAHGRVIGAELGRFFDFVGMDPRGVGESDAVLCLTDEQKEEYFQQDASPDENTSPEELVAANQEFGQQCEDKSGTLLPHVDTLSVARDLDVLREVLAEARLTYWGASYGTYLGAWYAETFPWRVGRLVLDGAVDPSLTPQEYNEGQVAGFDSALRTYVEYCLDHRGCPLRGTVEEAESQLADLVEESDNQPLRTDDGRELTQSLMVIGIIQALYADELWQVLTKGLVEAVRGEGTTLLQLADLYVDRGEDGSYGTVFDANPAIYCLDHGETRTLDQVVTDTEALIDKYPPLGNETAWSGLACLDWPEEAVLEPTRLTASGADPILVLGTLGDPATPYQWAESLSDQLSSGVLLTYEGEGHTAFRRGNDCIDDTVEAYLISGIVPEDRKRCAVE